jgi:RNA-binding protein
MRETPQLTGRQRRHLRALAHHLKPVVWSGKHGASPELLGTVARALAAHELIKVKFVEHKHRRQELTTAIAEGTGAAVAGVLGNMAILYLQHPDPERRTIHLPGAQPEGPPQGAPEQRR